MNNTTERPPKKPLSLLRAEAEYKELVVGSNEKVSLKCCSDGSAIITYCLSLTDGYFKGQTYPFSIAIPRDYPFNPPKATCLIRVLHPSIDDLGRVCLNITREDWSIKHGVQLVIFGLSSIFYDVPLEDPLNKEAHSILMRGPDEFIKEAERVYRSNRL